MPVTVRGSGNYASPCIYLVIMLKRESNIHSTSMATTVWLAGKPETVTTHLIGWPSSRDVNAILSAVRWVRYRMDRRPRTPLSVTECDNTKRRVTSAAPTNTRISGSGNPPTAMHRIVRGAPSTNVARWTQADGSLLSGRQLDRPRP